MGIPQEYKHIAIGTMKKGRCNLISDVEGVTVGHCTLSEPEKGIQTGVTAILPSGDNVFQNKLMAACHVINGFGKTTGLIQIEELGQLETPILLTNTLSVGTAYEALVEYMLENNPDIGETTGTINPVICECNDMGLNDIRGLHIRKEHIQYALMDCRSDFEEGAVGAGRGMRCHGLKGGIGSASRVFELDGKDYTLGALVLANHGRFDTLRIDGKRPDTSGSFARGSNESDKGSIITILATDAPVNERQLKRICRRAVIGLARAGSYLGNGSGDIVIGFTTANRVPHYPASDVLTCKMIAESRIDFLFQAAGESVEEAILSALLHAEPVTGKRGKTYRTLAEILKADGLPR